MFPLEATQFLPFSEAKRESSEIYWFPSSTELKMHWEFDDLCAVWNSFVTDMF